MIWDKVSESFGSWQRKSRYSQTHFSALDKFLWSLFLAKRLTIHSRVLIRNKIYLIFSSLAMKKLVTRIFHLILPINKLSRLAQILEMIFRLKIYFYPGSNAILSTQKINNGCCKMVISVENQAKMVLGCI